MTDEYKRLAERRLLAATFYSIILKATCRDKKPPPFETLAVTAVRHADALLEELDKVP